jgi:hypothetical protein
LMPITMLPPPPCENHGHLVLLRYCTSSYEDAVGQVTLFACKANPLP